MPEIYNTYFCASLAALAHMRTSGPEYHRASVKYLLESSLNGVLPVRWDQPDPRTGRYPLEVLLSSVAATSRGEVLHIGPLVDVLGTALNLTPPAVKSGIFARALEGSRNNPSGDGLAAPLSDDPFGDNSPLPCDLGFWLHELLPRPGLVSMLVRDPSFPDLKTAGPDLCGPGVSSSRVPSMDSQVGRLPLLACCAELPEQHPALDRLLDLGFSWEWLGTASISPLACAKYPEAVASLVRAGADPGVVGSGAFHRWGSNSESLRQIWAQHFPTGAGLRVMVREMSRSKISSPEASWSLLSAFPGINAIRTAERSLGSPLDLLATMPHLHTPAPVELGTVGEMLDAAQALRHHAPRSVADRLLWMILDHHPRTKAARESRDGLLKWLDQRLQSMDRIPEETLLRLEFVKWRSQPSPREFVLPSSTDRLKQAFSQIADDVRAGVFGVPMYAQSRLCSEATELAKMIEERLRSGFGAFAQEILADPGLRDRVQLDPVLAGYADLFWSLQELRFSFADLGSPSPHLERSRENLRAGPFTQADRDAAVFGLYWGEASTLAASVFMLPPGRRGWAADLLAGMGSSSPFNGMTVDCGFREFDRDWLSSPPYGQFPEGWLSRGPARVALCLVLRCDPSIRIAGPGARYRLALLQDEALTGAPDTSGMGLEMSRQSAAVARDWIMSSLVHVQSQVARNSVAVRESALLGGPSAGERQGSVLRGLSGGSTR